MRNSSRLVREGEPCRITPHVDIFGTVFMYMVWLCEIASDIAGLVHEATNGHDVVDSRKAADGTGGLGTARLEPL